MNTKFLGYLVLLHFPKKVNSRRLSLNLISLRRGAAVSAMACRISRAMDAETGGTKNAKADVPINPGMSH